MRRYIIGFLLAIFPFSTFAKTEIKVQLKWTYKNFPFQMQVYDVTQAMAPYISKTAIVKTLQDAPILSKRTTPIKMKANSSHPQILVVENSSDKELFFFAVPHEVHPVQASAGHFFECLCIGRVFSVPAHSIWYRIVRINLNSSFQNVSSFTIEHQVVGISEKEAKGEYKERLYSY